MGQKEEIVYKCKNCKKYAAGIMGAIGHSRSHGGGVTKATLKTMFTVVKDPPPEVLADIQKRREYQKNYVSKKKQNTTPPKNAKPKTKKKNQVIEQVLEDTPKLSRIIDAKVDENGVTFTAEITVSKDFFSSVIVQSIM